MMQKLDYSIVRVDSESMLNEALALLHKVYMSDVHSSVPASHPQGLRIIYHSEYGPQLVDNYTNTSTWYVAIVDAKIVGCICCYDQPDAKQNHSLQHFVDNWLELDETFCGKLSNSIAVGRFAILPAFRNKRLALQLSLTAVWHCNEQRRSFLTVGLQSKNKAFLKRLGLIELGSVKLSANMPYADSAGLFIGFVESDPMLAAILQKNNFSLSEI